MLWLLVTGERLLWSARFLTTVGLTVLVPLLPVYLAELGADDIKANSLWTGICLAAPAAMYMWAAPVWGRCGDRWSRKWMVVRALIGIAASLMVMGYVHTAWQLLVCRLLQGACGGVEDAVAAYVGGAAREQERGRILGSQHSAMAAGAVVGPLIGGTAVDLVGFRPLLLTIGLLIAVNALWVAVALKEGRCRSARAQWAPVSILGSFLDVHSHRRLSAFVVSGIWIQVGMFGMVTVFATHVGMLRGMEEGTATWVGFLQATLWGAAMVGAPWWGARNDRMRVETNFVLVAMGCGISLLVQAVAPDPAWLFPLRLVQGFCFGAVMPSILLVVTQESWEGNRGTRMGAVSSWLVIGQIFGALLAGTLGNVLSTQWVIALMGAAHVIGAAWLRLIPTAQCVPVSRSSEDKP